MKLFVGKVSWANGRMGCPELRPRGRGQRPARWRTGERGQEACASVLPIDICINNAIQFPSGGNTYAPTEGKCRFARGPSPAGAGPVGHGPVAERSGAPHPLCPEFRPALAAGPAPRGTRRFAGALLAGTPAEVGREPAPPLGEGASEGTPGARLPDAVVDHGPHRRSHPARVRSALPSRSCRSADASPEVEPPET